MKVKVMENSKKCEELKENVEFKKELDAETENKIMNLHHMTSYMYVIRKSCTYWVKGNDNKLAYAP